MAQTIEKRGFWTDLNLLIIDECHIQRKEIQKFARELGGTAGQSRLNRVAPLGGSPQPIRL